MAQPLPDKSIEPLPGYAPEVGRAVWMLEDARRRTLRDLAGLTTAALDTMPPAGSNTIGALLYHIAAIEASWLYEDVLQQPFPPEIEALFPQDVRDEQGILSATSGSDPESYLQRLEAVRDNLLLAYSQMTLDDFRTSRAVGEEYNVTPEWALHHLMQHEAEHRGQIQTLRTLLGA